MNLVAVLEGLLFLRGDEGISLSEIKAILDVNDEELKQVIASLETEYAKENHGVMIQKYGEYLKMVTKKEHKEYYQKLIEIDENSNLSQAALETLVIIAYNTPITRMAIDEIRGVSSSHIIRKLLNRNLIQEVGRSDSPGKPILYGVTPKFLDYFGINSVDELPKLEEIEMPEEKINLFDLRYKEE